MSRRGVATSARATAQPAIRPARADEMGTCADVWFAGLTDYERRLNQPERPRNLDPLISLLAHLRATDPERFLVATRPERELRGGEEIVAFSSATERGDVWFLAMLFVLPEVQGRGIGRELLEATLPASGRAFGDGAAEGPGVLATCTDSAQPISNGLYAGYGMVPRMPIVNLVGHVDGTAGLPALPSGIAAMPFDRVADQPGGPGDDELVAEVAGVDRALLGYDHGQDHRMLRETGRVGWLFRGPDGATLGYGYAARSGRLGPVAVLDPALLAPAVGHLMRAVPPAGAYSIWVPGAADRLFGPLLRAGLRHEGFPALMCWTRPFAAFERYVPMTLALL